MKQICFAVSLIVGTGVFGISGLALEVGGKTGSLFGWAIAAAAILPFLVVFYTLGKDGAERAVKSGTFDFLALSTYTIIVPTVAYVGSTYLQQAMGLSKDLLPFLTIAMLTLAMGVNTLGEGWLAGLAKVSCVVLVALLATTVCAHSGAVVESFTPSELPSSVTVWKTASLVFFAFIGWENLAGERRPLKVYLVSYAFVILLYGGLALVFSGSTTGAKGMTGLLDLLQGIPGGKFFIVGALLVILANVTSWMHGASRKLESKEASLKMYVVYVLVAGMLISHLVKVETLFQLVNKNFLVVYALMLVGFVRGGATPFRLVVAFFAILSSVFLVGEIGYELLFPFAILAVAAYLKWLKARQPDVTSLDGGLLPGI